MPINYEALKTLVNGLLQKMKSSRGNWVQNDPNADDYIKNRPFYTEQAEITVIPETSVVIEDSGNASFPTSIILETGKNYNVTFDNTSYSCVCYIADGSSCLGNISLAGDGEDTGEPFFLAQVDNTFAIVFASTVGTHTVKVTTYSEVIHKIDDKYLPPMDYVSFQEEQNLTYEQQEIILTNIGYAMDDKIDNSINNVVSNLYPVKYVTQNLTEEQKLQARTNIGAGDGDYNNLTNKPCSLEKTEKFSLDINDFSVYGGKPDTIAAIGLSRIIEEWTEEVNYVELIYTNFGKAFYTLDKTLVHNNTIYYGNPSLINSSFFDTEEEACVAYNIVSGRVECYSKIPQGSDIVYRYGSLTGYSAVPHKLAEIYIPQRILTKLTTVPDTIEDTTYTTARYRASSLANAETTPTTNGTICWMYE